MIFKFNPLFKAIIIATTLSGCATNDMIEPSFDTIDKKITFVPFCERDVYFFESEVGKEISGLLASVVAVKSDELRVVDIAPAIPLIKGKDAKSVNWQEVGRATGADYVVVGAIKMLRSRDPALHVNCYRGTLSAEICVFQTSTGGVVLKKDIVVHYPSGSFQQEFLSVLETTEEEVLWKVKERAVKEMAQLFYPHSPED